MAGEDIERLRQAALKDPAQLVRLADALVANDRAEEAVHACRRGLAKRPDDVALRLALGRALSAAGHSRRRRPRSSTRSRASRRHASPARRRAGRRRLRSRRRPIRGCSRWTRRRRAASFGARSEPRSRDSRDEAAAAPHGRRAPTRLRSAATGTGAVALPRGARPTATRAPPRPSVRGRATSTPTRCERGATVGSPAQRRADPGAGRRRLFGAARRRRRERGQARWQTEVVAGRRRRPDRDAPGTRVAPARS